MQQSEGQSRVLKKPVVAASVLTTDEHGAGPSVSLGGGRPPEAGVDVRGRTSNEAENERDVVDILDDPGLSSARSSPGLDGSVEATADVPLVKIEDGESLSDVTALEKSANGRTNQECNELDSAPCAPPILPYEDHTASEIAEHSELRDTGAISVTGQSSGEKDWSIRLRNEDLVVSEIPEKRKEGRLISGDAHAADGPDQPLGEQPTSNVTPLVPQQDESLKKIMKSKRHSAGRLMSVERSAKGLQVLSNLHEEYSKVRAAYDQEVAALRAKWDLKMRPIFEHRRIALLSAPEDASTDAGGSSAGTRLIPGFWLQVFLNNEVTAATLEPQDEDIFWYLENVDSEWEDPEKASGSFTLSFAFSENPYFHDRRLTKKYVLRKDGSEPDSIVLREIIGTPISWRHEAADVTKIVVHRKQRNRRTKETRTVTEVSGRKSFFNFFQTRKLPTVAEQDEMQKAEAEAQRERAGEDYDVGVVIRDDIIPLAFNWYLGVYSDSESQFGSSSSEPLGAEDNESEVSDDASLKERHESPSWFL